MINKVSMITLLPLLQGYADGFDYKTEVKKYGKTSELWYEQGVEDRVLISELKDLKKIFLVQFYIKLEKPIILHWSNGDAVAVLSILWTCLDDINSKYFLYESGLQGILLAKQSSGSFDFPSTYLMPIKKIKINAESTPGMTLEM